MHKIYYVLEGRKIKLTFEIGFKGLMEGYFLPLEEHFSFSWLLLTEVVKKKNQQTFCKHFKAELSLMAI